MVDQAQVTTGNGAPKTAATPAPTTATRAVAHNAAELLADAVTLAELQVDLFRCDWRQFVSRLIWPAVAFVTGAVILASCVPLGLVTAALALNELTTFTPAQSFAITLGVALALGGVIALIAAWYLRHSVTVWERSRHELSQNVRWMKRMVQRLGRATKSRPTPRAVF